MGFEIWHNPSGNIVNSYRTEADALAVVREALRRHGLAYVEGLSLLYEDTRGRTRTVASGAHLAHLAQLAESGPAIRSRRPASKRTPAAV